VIGHVYFFGVGGEGIKSWRGTWRVRWAVVVGICPGTVQVGFYFMGDEKKEDGAW